MKVAVMAVGQVGFAVLEFLFSKHPLDVIAVILPDNRGWDDLELYLSDRMPGHIWRLAWADRGKLKECCPDIILLAWWPLLLSSKIATRKLQLERFLGFRKDWIWALSIIAMNWMPPLSSISTQR